MNQSNACQSRPKVYSAYALLLFLVFLVYSNTFHAGWHFDDRNSIVDNPKIHITDVKPSTLRTAIEHPEKEQLWRPLSYLTFASNWYLGQKKVIGYHLVNILIHLAGALILFHALIDIFEPRSLRGYPVVMPITYRFSRRFCRTINPIHTQAVTYIVQRMTLLAGLSYICGIFFYLRARLTKHRRARYLFMSYVSSVGCWAWRQKKTPLPCRWDWFLWKLLFLDTGTMFEPGKEASSFLRPSAPSSVL